MGKAVEQAKKKLPRSGLVHLAKSPTISFDWKISYIIRISHGFYRLIPWFL
jgi:hypothetical protein